MNTTSCQPERVDGSLPRRVLVLGATGTIGSATVRELVRRNHGVVCFLRERKALATALQPPDPRLDGAGLHYGDLTDPASVASIFEAHGPFDAVVSCMSSRTGAPKDAWAIDYKAHELVLNAARRAGVAHMVLLSAICVQKPMLAFQQAKLEFENLLIGSGLVYSIVRPTAFFKSLSGQIDRVKQGKPFLVFGDGRQTACKPISDDDLACYLAQCLDDPALQNAVLPIGGPGQAITPIEQGEHLFALLGRTPRFRHVPVAMLSMIARGLDGLGLVVPAMADKAELARIGHYYATQSMLVLNPATGRYDADATPSFGSQTLFDHYRRVINGEVSNERGDHAVF